jgi:hypothetical protein
VSEAADLDLSVKLGKKKVVRSSAAFADPVTRTIALTVPPASRKLIKGLTEIEVKGIASDVTGKTVKVADDRRIGPKKKKKGKARK